MTDTLYSAMKFIITGEDHGASKSVEDLATTGERASQKVAAAFGHMGSVVGGEVGNLIGQTSSMFDELGQHGLSMNEKLGIAGAGLAALGVGLQMLGSKDREAENMLAAAIAQTGGHIDDYKQQIEETIHAQENFGHSASETQGALATLVQITGNTNESLKAMTTVADLAAARHMDLASAAKLVGQAMEGQGRLIKLYNVDVQSAAKVASELAKAQKAVATETAAVAADQQKITAAQQAYTDAQSKAALAADAYKTAQDSAAQANQNAATALATAEQHLTDAHLNEETAQNNLTLARQNAAQALVDLGNKVVDATLAQEGAQIAVADAQQNLARVMGSASSTQLDKEKAQLQYDMAVQKLKEQTEATKTLQTEKSKADAAGINGSASVVNAETAVRKAHEATAAAVLALSKAHEAEAMTAEKSSLSVARAAQANVLAQQGVAKAEENVSKATTKLATDQAKLATAHHDLTAAQDASKDSVDRMNTVLTDLEKHLGGSAAAAVDSFSGRLQVMKVKIEDWASNFGNKWGGMITAIGVGVMVAGPLLGGLGALWGMLTGGTAAAAAATDVAAASIGTAGAASAASAPEAIAFGAGLASILVPIALIVVAVVGLVALFVYLLTHLKEVGQGIEAVFHGIGFGWKALIDGFIGGTKDIIGFVMGIPQDMVNMFAMTANAVQDILKMIVQAIANLWNSTVGSLGFDLPFGLGHIGIPKINAGSLTAGLTPIQAPNLAAQSGIARSSSSHGSGGGINITINGAIDPVSTGRQVHQALTTYQRQALGGRPLGLN